ncbi:MAG TPA: DUF2203 domain-containing protein [Actinomycetota bacterium]|nr:DUF2203 domain-containing protein [Actinomycetota bacterium]
MSSEREGERLFTVEEANAQLERLRISLDRIREARQVVLRSGERVRETAPSDGGGMEGETYWNALRTLREEMEGLAADGIVLRDAESGLVDFPAEREGRVIQLCWRLGEERVAFWHEVDAGFGNRKPLEP